MRLARYFAVLLLTCAVIYGGFWAASYLSFPPQSGFAIDTDGAKESIYGTEPKYLLFSVDRLQHPGKRVIFLGASNVREGFRPVQIERRLPGMEVDNLAIGSAEIRETEEVAEEVYDHVPASSWRDLTFVVGVWYGMFQPDRLAWPDKRTDLDRERLRYGLYSVEGARMRRRVPLFLEPAVEEALRPLFFISRMYEHYTAPLITSVRVAILRFTGEKPADLFIADRDTFQLMPADRVNSLALWRQRMGPADRWGDEPFRRFDDLARFISGHGSRFVILDLPLPDWHRLAVPYDAEYLRLFAPHLNRAMALPGVSYSSMREGFLDNQFYDSAHPRPHIVGAWADRASAAITRAN